MIVFNLSLSILVSFSINGLKENQGEPCLSAVFFAVLTCRHVQFSKIFAVLFSPKINIYLQANLVLRENPEITKQWQSGLVFLCSGKHSFECKKVSYNKPLHNKSRCVNTMKSFLNFKVINLGYSCIFKKFLLWNFGKTPSSRQRFCSALYSPPSAVNTTL